MRRSGCGASINIGLTWGILQSTKPPPKLWQSLMVALPSGERQVMEGGSAVFQRARAG